MKTNITTASPVDSGLISYAANDRSAVVHKGSHSIVIGVHDDHLLVSTMNLAAAIEDIMNDRVGSTLYIDHGINADGAPFIVSQHTGLPKFAPDELNDLSLLGCGVRMDGNNPEEASVEVSIREIGMAVDVFQTENGDGDLFALGLTVSVDGDFDGHCLDVFFNADGTFSCAG